MVDEAQITNVCTVRMYGTVSQLEGGEINVQYMAKIGRRYCDRTE